MTNVVNLLDERSKRSKARHQIAQQALTARAAKVAFGNELLDRDFDDFYSEAIAAVSFNMANE